MYEYRKGESLDTLAKNNGTTIEAILKANGVRDASQLTDGQQIIIPGVDENYSSSGTHILTSEQTKTSYAPSARLSSDEEKQNFLKQYGDGKNVTYQNPAVQHSANKAGSTDTDETWRIYEQSRRRLAKEAADNALGAYSQNTGGRANSYAVTAAANASNEILSTLPQERLNWEAQQQNMKATTFNQQLAVAKQKADFGSYGELASLLGISEEQVAANYSIVGDDVMTQILETMIKDGDYEAALRFAGIDYDPSIFNTDDDDDDPGAPDVTEGFADIFAKYPDGSVPQDVYDKLVSEHGKDAVDGAGIKVGGTAVDDAPGDDILTAQMLGRIYEVYPDGVVDNEDDWDGIMETYGDFTLIENGVVPSRSVAENYLAKYGVSPMLLDSNKWSAAKQNPRPVQAFYKNSPELLGLLTICKTYDEFVIRFLRAAKEGKI